MLRVLCASRTRGHVDTLLVCDGCNHRIVETTATGAFKRAIKFPGFVHPYGVAYCARGDVIAVSYVHTVVLMRYVCKSLVVQLGHTHIRGSGDGQLFYPRGVRFTADGSCLLVADSGNHRVCKFNATDGTFMCHVATKEAHGIEMPMDVIESEDGGIAVACRGGVVVVNDNEATLVRSSDNGFRPLSLFSTGGDTWVNETSNAHGRVVIADSWYTSLRCAWVSACVALKNTMT
jgi:hypothetical protein